MTVFGIFFIFAIYLGHYTIHCNVPTQREGFFNVTSFVKLRQPLTLNKHIGLSFRSCTGGQLFLQNSISGSISLEVRPEGLFFVVTILKRYESHIKAHLLDNEWHTVNILYRLGNLTLSTSGHQQIIANSTYNYDILNNPELTSASAQLVVGNGFSGCILEGPSIVFNPEQMSAHNVEWGPCPLSPNPCGVDDHCFHEPCMMHGRCISLSDRYHCQCTPRYSGNNCQIDNGPPCNSNPCRNNGQCIEDSRGNFTCICPSGFVGRFCETMTRLCDNNPCKHNGTCISVEGPELYKCLCGTGFMGKDCEIDIDECSSNPCQHGGTCLDRIGNYTCFCGRTGYTGDHCEVNINECENNPCLNNGVCFDNYGGYTCQCTDGFSGSNCEQKLSECASSPCHFPNTVCKDIGGTHQCICKPGYTGPETNCVPNDGCLNKPCTNGATCIPIPDGFKCICPPGFTGILCESKVDNCKSNPCQNGGTCFDTVDSYTCNCTADFMGVNCEHVYSSCALNPCQNGGECFPKEDKKDYTCNCLRGFEGQNCEINLNECSGGRCPESKSCADGDCRCADGFSGPNCAIDIPYCSSDPCVNGATCIDSPGNYSCLCTKGYKGRRCEIEDCSLSPDLCINGICTISNGTYKCFCTPGYSGDRCEIDFDECLSLPCHNQATCRNEINGYTCICKPGYTGKDCGVNIDDCDPNPCVVGSTCVDGIATFSCVCPAGLTGKRCETNIDDCESSPCINGGMCIDGLNSYTCNCSDTGYDGLHCEHNIDECESNPCVNGGKCKDMVKGYICDCYPGYKGINCEIDIDECESNPCQHGGTCYQKSNVTYYISSVDEYDVMNPPVFNYTFNYSTAAGYECHCRPGTTGFNCEEDTDECLSSPCKFGSCNDFIDRYECVCELGYEGTHCDVEIDECERYKPCAHGMCYDKKADYVCDCETSGSVKYGGKNCSVELIGCVNNSCQNNGTCTPYLENETEHTFNCSCPNGFQGHICEKVTTMSLNGSSYVMVNTTREVGYDIQLRFKTTIPDGLLAIGKGLTFYILELVKGRLNLKSSLLNKWEGVFIGSALNDSKWQKVFVAINSSHLVLAANEEQTIYPINLNEGSNASHTSFTTTYLGGTISYLRKLTDGPSSFIGCIEDAMINGQWVLPQDSGVHPISFIGVEVGCKREAQCTPNPCHSGGHCTDLWRNFSCSCERPYLGHTCQYNITAATFGYEKINNSVVDVIVDQQARRAVRSILDISMFIRTREPTGGIFYLGSHPENVLHQDQTVIATKLSGGELLLQIQFNASLERYSVGGVRLDNGFNHLIQVIRNVTLVQVKINDTEYFRKAIGATEHLDPQILRLGNGSVPSDTPVRNFKGVIQDVQVSDGSRVMVVEFFPLVAEDLDVLPPLGEVTFDHNSVLQGVVSDDNCQSQPCMHGGTCTVTWNDFSCICTVGHKGKQCQEMEFCQIQDCPTGSECRNLNNGYECVANITLHDFNETATGLRYRFVSKNNISVPLNEVSVSYRSQKGGTILQIGPDEEDRFLAISVQKERVTVTWILGEGIGERGLYSMPNDVVHLDWITVGLKISSDNVLSGTLATEQQFKANFSLDAWNELVTSSEITIGGTDSKVLRDKLTYKIVNNDQTNAIEHSQGASSSEEISSLGTVFKGCIGEVRIGGLLLPYFTAEELNLLNSTDRVNFELIPGSTMGEQFGCMLCYDEDCQNGGICENATESYECQCVAGYQGEDCSENIDECKENDCKNNSTCEDLIAAYSCLCQPGWEGTLCDKEIDECASNPCFNNGTCIDHFAKFECRCGPDFIGQRCEQVKQITCESQPCFNNATCENVVNQKTNDNFTCICQDGFEGDYCKSAFCEVTPCQNQGLCLSSLTKPVCDCKFGFTGRLCETDIDDCASSPCKHKGNCLDGVGKYSCDCLGTGYTGPTCEIDVDECATDSVNCGPTGECINTVGGFYCKCEFPYCGLGCNITDPCSMSPCKNGGTCIPECMERRDYQCNCTDGFVGVNCTEKETLGSSVTDVAIIVGPIVAILLIIGFVGLTVFLMMARKKRATRGTYSPSSQEYCNPRVELDNVMKPPPEERLI